MRQGRVPARGWFGPGGPARYPPVMDWNDLRYVLALARHGSVRAAGQSLGVSHSTVARRLDQLEADLGARLFDRGPDGYVLNATGRRALPAAERAERELAELERSVVGEDKRVEGAVAVTCGERFVAEVVTEALVDVCGRHPGIEPTVSVDGRPFDLARREADLAVRALGVGDLPPEALLGTRVAPVLLATYVGAEHRARLDPALGGTPSRWLGFDDARLVARLRAGSSFPDLPTWGRFNTLDAIVPACREGLGLAMLPVYAGDAVPGLRRLSVPDVRHLGDLWILCHPDLRLTGRVRAVRAALAGAFERRAGRFAAWTVSDMSVPEFAPSGEPGPALP